MRLFKLFLFGIFLAAFWSCSDLGDTYVEEVEGECPDGQVKDCTGVCGGLAVEDCTGECGGTNQDCLSYSTQIQPIFSANCTGCHGGLGGLVLTSYTNLMAGGNSGAVVLANNGSGSLIIQKLRGEDIPAMPYNDSYPLENSLIDSIETWINEGAQNN